VPRCCGGGDVEPAVVVVVVVAAVEVVVVVDISTGVEGVVALDADGCGDVVVVDGRVWETAGVATDGGALGAGSGDAPPGTSVLTSGRPAAGEVECEFDGAAAVRSAEGAGFGAPA